MDMRVARSLVDKSVDLFTLAVRFDVLERTTPLRHDAPEPLWSVLESIDQVQRDLLDLIDRDVFTTPIDLPKLRHLRTDSRTLADGSAKENLAMPILKLATTVLSFEIRREVGGGIDSINEQVSQQVQQALLLYLNPTIVRDYKIQHSMLTATPSADAGEHSGR